LQNEVMWLDDLPEAEQAQWIRRNASYIILPGLVDDLDSRKVAIFERPDHSSGDRIAVTFNDNATRTMQIDEARELIRAQTGKTLEELIERQQRIGDNW